MISIIIPIYNPAERLRILLDCVRKQSEKDFEVLMIDDGSTEDSGEICDNYARLDNRFCAVHQPNSGVSAARNRGLSDAKGEFVAFLDADDEIPENYLSVLLQTQQETDADIVVCDVVIIQEGRETGRFTQASSVLKQVEALNLLLSRRIINPGPCAKLFRKKTICDVQFPPLRVYEDVLFVRDVFCNAEKIAITDKTEYRYIQNDESAMHRNNNSPSLDIIKATDNLCEFIHNHPELDPYCFYITISHMMQYAIPLLKRREKNEFVKKTMGLLRKNQWKIITCPAFPWKEKLLFMWYAHW